MKMMKPETGLLVGLMLGLLVALPALADPAGAVDSTFALGTGPNGNVQAISEQSEGRIFVAGIFSQINGVDRWGVARLHPTGQLDTSFQVSLNSFDYQTLAQTADNKLYVGGTFLLPGGQRRTMARLYDDGRLDTGFSLTTGSTDDRVYALLEQPDGLVLVGGNFDVLGGLPYKNLARVYPNGGIDLLFGPGNGAGSPYGINVNGDVYAIARQPDGKIIIGGSFSEVNGVSRGNIARLLPNGYLDTTFNTGTGFSWIVRSVVIQPDGKVLVGGQFSSVNGSPRKYVARLQANGAVDTSFNAGTGPDSYVRSVVLQADGKILLGGSFSAVDGSARAGLARLHADGSVDAVFDPGSMASPANVQVLALQADGKLLVSNETSGSRLFRLHTGNADGDGVEDAADMFPADPAEWLDSDLDGVGDNSDAFPLDPAESVDTDNDGIGNNADHDDDGDGVPDAIDSEPLDPAVTSEVTLPLDAGYKGSAMKESAD